MKKRVPKLRFPEFSGEWEAEKMGNAGSFRKGGKLSKADISTSGTPCILYGELYTTYEEIVSTVYLKTNVPKKELVFAKPGDLLIPASGETEIDISTATCIISEGIALGGDFNVYHSDKLDCRFLSYEINHSKKIDIAKLAQGKSIVHIKPESLSTIIIDYPQLKEQQKIAGFLSTVDNIIASEQRILDDLQLKKKGLMQKLFNRELRFKDKDGKEFPEWEEKRLGEITTTFKAGESITAATITETGKYPVYGGNGFRGYTTTFTHDGQYILIGRQGALCGNIKYIAGENFVSEHAIAVQTDQMNSNKYLYFFLDYCDLNKLSESSAQGGLSVNKLVILKYLFPCLDEQKKIAEYLGSLDNVIEEQQKIVARWKLRKKGLLQQMFV